MVQAMPEHDTTEPAKRGPHRWPKGTSGNPSGRARHVLADGRSVREHAREATHEALALLQQCMRDHAQPMQLRIDAARTILRTGHADVVRSVDGEARQLVVQVVSYADAPPVGGFPGVLNHPDPRWIELKSVHAPNEVGPL